MADNNSRQIFTGASGIVLPVPNKLLFPLEFQDKSRLTYYSSLFNTIEVNSSFYKLPIASTLKRWSESVSDDFKFTFKLWREITHSPQLNYNPDHVHQFFERINAVGGKKGCLLVQFPPSLTSASLLQLQKLLMTINEAKSLNAWNVVLEFRNRSWYETEIYELVNQHGCSIVLQDLPASATPFVEQVADVIYVRFHGPNGGYRGSYSDDFLYEYAQYTKEWSAEGKAVYVYFNNTMGAAVHNLITFNSYLSS